MTALGLISAAVAFALTDREGVSAHGSGDDRNDLMKQRGERRYGSC